jgi:undecaprenyl diphosphate synthase
MPKEIKTPTHIAIICDGNRRWARAHQLEVFMGHQRAVNEIFEPLIDHAAARGIKFLTFWVFSTENWDRDPKEVGYLMELFRSFFTRQIDELHAKNIRVAMIGDLSKLAPDIQEKITEGMEKTRGNTGITVTLALNHGGKDDIIRAVQKLATQIQVGDLQSSEINRDLISATVDTGLLGIPDPDFIIRTSGEQRTSGFMMWQAEYAEWWFPEFHFPEFTPAKLDEALEEYTRRQRRFGK